MIKNRLKTLLVGATLIGTSLLADTSTYDFGSHSLVGIEGGYSRLGYEYGTRASNNVNSVWISHAGLKIGAETEDFRVFLSGRYFYDSSRVHDYIVTYGGEFQYKFNATKVFNFYMGVNAGIANLKFRSSTESYSRTISDPYFGGDLGINIHLGSKVDWEIGGRVMSIQADNTRDGKTYHVNEIVSAYSSIIFKWQMK